MNSFQVWFTILVFKITQKYELSYLAASLVLLFGCNIYEGLYIAHNVGVLMCVLSLHKLHSADNNNVVYDFWLLRFYHMDRVEKDRMGEQ